MLRPVLFATALAVFPAGLHGQRAIRNPVAQPTPGTGIIAVEAEALLPSSIATHGRAVRQDMRPFGSGWSNDAQLFWAVAQPGAQLRLTFKTAVTGRYQVFLRFTKAPDFAFVRASFDGAPSVSFNGYAPTVSRDRALLGMLDLAPGVRELLVKVARKDGKSTGYNVGLDRIELEPVSSPKGAVDRERGSVQTIGGQREPAGAVDQQHEPIVSSSTGTAKPVQPVIPRARLAFAQFIPDGGAILGPAERNLYRPDLTVTLAWEAVGTGKLAYRWQVLREAMSRETAPSVSPPGLLAEGPVVPVQGNTFRISLGDFPPLGTASAVTGSPTRVGVNRATLRTTTRTAGGTMTRVSGGPKLPDRPLNLYIRIIPEVEGKPLAVPSNMVVAHFVPGSDPGQARVAEAFAEAAKRAARLAEMTTEAKVLQLSIVKFTPMIFEDPNRWGCVYVIQNPYAGKQDHALGRYVAGHEYCGKSFKGSGYQADSFWDVVTGWAKAYDILATFYDGAKSWVADKIGQLAPCEAMGDKLEGSCEDFVKQAASAAMSAGLAAAGVPPTLPNLSELQGAAEGKVAEAAADYTCKEFESRGGHCTPEMRKALAEAYKIGIDKIQAGIVKDAKEPGCGDIQLAHEHGRGALPCFTDYPGTDVRPAKGAVTEPATVAIRVKQVKPTPSFGMPGCTLKADLQLTNHFPGANLHGVDYGPSTLYGNPFLPAEAVIPALGPGDTFDVTLVFSRWKPFAVPGHYNATIWWDDWLYLYRGGQGPLSASALTATPVPGAKAPNGKDMTLSCGQSTQTLVQIPD